MNTAFWNKIYTKYQYIHHSIKSRKKFRNIYLLLIIGICLLYVGCVVLFYFGGINYPGISDGSSPRLTLQICGIVLFLITTGLNITFVSIIFPVVFMQSQKAFEKTTEFKNNVKKYSRLNLTQLPKRELKWIYKLHWINKVQLEVAIGAKKRDGKK